MSMQIQSRPPLPALLVVVACLAVGASAQAQDAPASVQPAAAPATAPVAPPVAPLPGPVDSAQSAQAAPAAAPAPAADAAPGPVTPLTGSPSCFLSPLAIDPAAVMAFRSAPQNLLTPYPDGGSRMAQDVRGLAGTDIHTVPMLIDLARNASPGQMAAIGAGLAQTARACVRQRPDVAQIIQESIIRAGLAPLATAFAASSGDVATAATGGGAAAGGAASAGGITGSPGGGDTSGSGGGVPSTGGVSFSRSTPNATISTFGAGGSSVVINLTLGGGSVSPVR